MNASNRDKISKHFELAAGIEQGLWVPLLPTYASRVPGMNDYLPGAAAMQKLDGAVIDAWRGQCGFEAPQHRLIALVRARGLGADRPAALRRYARLSLGCWCVVAFSGVVDAAILARLEANWAGRQEGERSQAWIDRQMSRVHGSVKAVSQGLGEKPWCSGTHFTLADVAVGCALGYLDFRFPHIDWRSDYPNLAKYHEKLTARQSFIDTQPPAA